MMIILLQWNRGSNPGAKQSDLYGTEHLLRLVAKLPSLLQDAKMAPETAKHLYPRIMELLRYIERNAATLLLSAYRGDGATLLL
jgi:hypothetical protein